MLACDVENLTVFAASLHSGGLEVFTSNRPSLIEQLPLPMSPRPPRPQSTTLETSPQEHHAAFEAFIRRKELLAARTIASFCRSVARQPVWEPFSAAWKKRGRLQSKGIGAWPSNALAPSCWYARRKCGPASKM